jgi:hypothetical protein
VGHQFLVTVMAATSSRKIDESKQAHLSSMLRVWMRLFAHIFRALALTYALKCKKGLPTMGRPALWNGSGYERSGHTCNQFVHEDRLLTGVVELLVYVRVGQNMQRDASFSTSNWP